MSGDGAQNLPESCTPIENDLPEGWIEITLDQILQALESGSRPKGGVKGIAEGIPSIGGEHIGENGGFRFEKIKFVPHSFFKQMNHGHIQSGDILVVKDGATTGKVALVRNDFPYKPAVINEHVFICRPEEPAHPPFLFYFLFSKEGQDRILENFRGSAQGGINQNFAPGTSIPLAPLVEQKRIAAKVEELLARVNSARERLAKVSVILKHFRQAVLSAACSGRLTEDWRDSTNLDESAQQFLKNIDQLRENVWKAKWGNRRKLPAPFEMDSTDLPDIPSSWEWSSADSVCAQITDGEHIQPSYQPVGRPMLSAKHVRDGYVTCDGGGLISEADFNRCLQRCAPEQGDILVVSVGATTGRSAIVENCPPFVIVRSVLLLKPLLPARFFLRWTQSPWCFIWMTRASGASAQPHLYIKDIKRMPVPVPPFAEQQEIVRRVEALFGLAHVIEKRVSAAAMRAEKLTQAILVKAFRGELVPTEAELARREGRSYESASELLARIKSEREASRKSESEHRYRVHRKIH